MAPTRRKLRIGIVFGGRSSEYEVSLASATSVISYLDAEKYEVTPIGITRDGKWLVGITPAQLLQEEQEASNRGQALTSAANLATEPGPISIGNGSSLLLGERLDVIFPILHGTYGEDGTIQGLLELADVPYVGCGVLGAALGMDKDKMKLLFRAVGLSTVETVVCRRSEWRRSPERLINTIEHQIGYPCFVKPANGGSSVGVSKAYTRANLEQALQLAARYDAKVVVEKAINCRELSCAVIGNDDPITSMVGEVIVTHDFYDYRAKYLNSTSYTVVPADIPRALSDTIRFQAVQAFRALDLCGLARVDFFLDTKTGELLINEVNTLPSFTKQCLYPKLCETIGLSYPLLLEHLIDLALERHADRHDNHTRVHIDTPYTNTVGSVTTADSTQRFLELISQQVLDVDPHLEPEHLLIYQHLPC